MTTIVIIAFQKIKTKPYNEVHSFDMSKVPSISLRWFFSEHFYQICLRKFLYTYIYTYATFSTNFFQLPNSSKIKIWMVKFAYKLIKMQFSSQFDKINKLNELNQTNLQIGTIRFCKLILL